MNETEINPFVGFALDAYPFTCEKYGTEKVACFVELCYKAQVNPIECMLLLETFLPLTKEEQVIQEEMIQRNMKALFMLQPEMKEEFEKFCESLEKHLE